MSITPIRRARAPRPAAARAPKRTANSVRCGQRPLVLATVQQWLVDHAAGLWNIVVQRGVGVVEVEFDHLTDAQHFRQSFCD